MYISIHLYLCIEILSLECKYVTSGLVRIYVIIISFNFAYEKKSFWAKNFYIGWAALFVQKRIDFFLKNVMIFGGIVSQCLKTKTQNSLKKLLSTKFWIEFHE